MNIVTSYKNDNTYFHIENIENLKTVFISR